MKKFAVSTAALAALAAAAAAQDIDEILRAEPAAGEQAHEPELDRGIGAAADPASELDALSQGASEDPFPLLEEKAQRKGVSVTLRALNKIVARYVDIDIKIGETAKFGSLEILPRYCDARPPVDFPETTAFLEVFDRDLARARSAASVEARDISARAAPVRVAAPAADSAAPATKPVDPDRIFSGWMFASSPGLNPLEHSVYDVWVIGCKTVPIEG